MSGFEIFHKKKQQQQQHLNFHLRTQATRFTRGLVNRMCYSSNNNRKRNEMIEINIHPVKIAKEIIANHLIIQMKSNKNEFSFISQNWKKYTFPINCFSTLRQLYIDLQRTSSLTSAHKKCIHSSHNSCLLSDIMQKKRFLRKCLTFE